MGAQCDQCGGLRSARAAGARESRVASRGRAVKQEAPDPDAKRGLHLNSCVVTTSPNIGHT